MQIIPFKTPAFWQEQITLDNEIFILSFKWNALNEFWVMNILSRDEVPIILGIVIVPDYNLTAQYAAIPGMPKGDIICQNIINAPDTISRFDMSQKFELIYYAFGELDAI